MNIHITRELSFQRAQLQFMFVIVLATKTLSGQAVHQRESKTNKKNVVISFREYFSNWKFSRTAECASLWLVAGLEHQRDFHQREMFDFSVFIFSEREVFHCINSFRKRKQKVKTSCITRNGNFRQEFQLETDEQTEKLSCEDCSKALTRRFPWQNTLVHCKTGRERRRQVLMEY